MTIKEKITKEYGTLNKFFEAKFDQLVELGISRPHVYKLIQHRYANPTIETIVKVSKLTEISPEEIFAEFLKDYKEKKNGTN